MRLSSAGLIRHSGLPNQSVRFGAIHLLTIPTELYSRETRVRHKESAMVGENDVFKALTITRKQLATRIRDHFRDYLPRQQLWIHHQYSRMSFDYNRTVYGYSMGRATIQVNLPNQITVLTDEDVLDFWKFLSQKLPAAAQWGALQARLETAETDLAIAEREIGVQLKILESEKPTGIFPSVFQRKKTDLYETQKRILNQSLKRLQDEVGLLSKQLADTQTRLKTDIPDGKIEQWLNIYVEEIRQSDPSPSKIKTHTINQFSQIGLIGL